MPRRSIAILVGIAAAATTAGAQGTRLLRHPTISRESIAFEYGGDLWVTSRAGGAARRFSATPELENVPRFRRSDR
jgi:tricorn protease